ncbi:MAG: hypothetical protein KatS3mg125_1020 [Lysobacterales bacterium]|nr:MAG: hypothetical protein KatS3mg125_1020 [Xanthomonadales bacterium]
MIDPSVFSDSVPIATSGAGEPADRASEANWVEDASRESWTIGRTDEACWSFPAEDRFASSDLPVRPGNAGIPCARRWLDLPFRKAFCVRAETHQRLRALERGRLDLLLTCSQVRGIPAAEVGGRATSEDADRMRLRLANRALRNAPAPSPAPLFARFRSENFAEAATIIREGDRCARITYGEPKLCRRTPKGGERGFDRQAPRCGFAEEALLGAAPRNAAARTAEAFVGMALEQREFERLLERFAGRDRAPEECGDQAVLLDARTPQEDEAHHPPDRLDVARFEGRAAAERSARDRIDAVDGETGVGSAAAACLLCERGFDARRLRSHQPPRGGIA